MRRFDTEIGAERGTTVASTEMQLTWRKVLFVLCSLAAFVTFFAFAGGASAMHETAAVAPSMTTDQEDYNPGATVTLIGAGWAAGEAVHIVVNDDKSQPWSYT